MCISVNQYRCAIGIYNNRVFVRGDSIFGKSRNFNLASLLGNLLTRPKDRTNVDCPKTNYTVFNILKIIFIFICFYLLILTLAMHIENCVSQAIMVNKSNGNSSSYNMDNKNALSLHYTFLNWFIIVILFYAPGSSNKGNTIFYRILTRPNFIRSKSTHTISDLISSVYTKYVTIINLILIIVVTPSIVNPGPIVQTQSCNHLKISYCNVQGLILSSTMRGSQPIFQTNKLLDFQTFIHSGVSDIIIVNESWLNESVFSNEIVNENYYKSFRLDRSQMDKTLYNKVGGVGC